jgi:SAM-dependent methyltransferase
MSRIPYQVFTVGIWANMDVRTYSVDELREIAEAVGERNGWDFSRMATERDPVPWDYVEVVERFLQPADAVLDIGTGGGERLLSLSDRFGSAIGVDPDPDMVRVAQANGAGVSHVRFLQASAESLAPLGDAAFDVVLTRHAPVSLPELDRVTRAGGLFICQGVGSRNMANIRHAFNTGSEILYERAHRALLRGLVDQGWRLVATGEYDVAYRVLDVPSLIFWFKAIAGANEVPADFNVETHHDVINRLILEYGTERGLVTNEHRMLVIARKSDA